MSQPPRFGNPVIEHWHSLHIIYVSLFLQAQAEAAIAEQEREVGEVDQEYTQLQKDLADSLDLLEQEMKKVKRLQRQMADGRLQEGLLGGEGGGGDILVKWQNSQGIINQEFAGLLRKNRDCLL